MTIPAGAPRSSLRETSIAAFLIRLVQRCPAVRSIWVIGGGGDAAADAPTWDLVAFADPLTLHRLRDATDLHRPDVLLRVVTDGDRFGVAWGKPHICGSLLGWGWAQASEHDAYYSEARWQGPVEARKVERTRRNARRLWPSAENYASELLYWS